MIIILALTIPIFVVPLLITKFVSSSDNQNKYLKWYICYFFMYIFFMIIFGNSDLLNKGLSVGAPSSNEVAEGFTIEGYEVTLDVGIDNKVEVTENIDVNFYESGHHGIKKFTPYWLEYTGKDGKTIKRKANILDDRAENDPYTIDRVNKKERIKIGDANRFVEGEHTYIIKYTYDMGKDPFQNFDEFIFHAFGDYWGTQIKNPRIIINMPKGIDGNTINFYADKYRKENINEYINYTINGNQIVITGKDNLYLSKSLTIDIELPENYFVGGSFNYGFVSFAISIIIIIMTIYVIYMWIKYGKDHEKRVPTVEFYAPDDLSSAEIGYIYNKRQATKKLTIALIIQLASKGYLKINEIKDGKRSKIEITKTYIKPKELKKEDIVVPERIIEVKKLKEIDDTLEKKEETMMKYLFRNSDTKVLESNIKQFEEVKDKLISGGYISIIKNINTPEEKYNELYEEANKTYNEALEQYNEAIKNLKEKTALENIVYGNLFSIDNSIILSEHTSFYKTFNQIGNKLENEFKKKIHDDHARKKRIISLIITFITIILSLTSFFEIEDLNPTWSTLYQISFICIFINFFFSMIMGRKTEYGEEIYARVLGFKDFLLKAEKEKLESLVEENPNYFYDILPYTYVLNISKKWIKKFENIKVPETDMGNFDYSSDASFHSIFDNVYYPPSSSTSSSSSSGGCGGGCSSCGGGCSSCGGGGSW